MGESLDTSAGQNLGAASPLIESLRSLIQAARQRALCAPSTPFRYRPAGRLAGTSSSSNRRGPRVPSMEAACCKRWPRRSRRSSAEGSMLRTCAT